MQVDYPNLKVSPTGWYSYRRAIPNRLRWLFEERREYKVSFKTKNKNHAVRKWHEQESLWARTQSLALNLAANQDKQSLRELQVQAENLRLSWGLTDNDLSNMETLQRDEIQVDAASLLQEMLTDETRRDENYRSGLGITSPTRPLGRSAHELALLGISGSTLNMPAITFFDVLDHYLKEVGPTKKDEVTRVKFIKSTKSIFNKVAELMTSGLATEVQTLSSSEASRDNLRVGIREMWPNAGTRKRNLSPVNAAISKWNEFHDVRLSGTLFSGVVSRDEYNDSKRERRSFTPKEYQLFFDNVAANIASEEVLLFLRIMSETGARNNEVTSLELNDVKPKEETPHLIYRGNTIRGLSKDGLERAVPISQDTAERILRFVGEDVSRTPLFPFYSDQNKGTDLSKMCSDQVVNLRPKDDRLLSTYSLRHTFIDKLRTVGVSTNEAQYLVGHKDPESSRVHAKYGTMPPPRHLADQVNSAINVDDWGYFEKTDWES